MVNGTVNGPIHGIQTIAAKDFILNSNNIKTVPTVNINGRNYILINITDIHPTVYMIDNTNYYVSGYMHQDINGNYTYICCSGGEVIAHSTKAATKSSEPTFKKVAFSDFKQCNKDLPDLNNPYSYPLNVGKIKEKLDTIAFILCESFRFEAIHDYLRYSSSAQCTDLMILANNWTEFGRNRIHIPKKETLQWLYRKCTVDSRIKNNPLYIYLETGRV
jgi:hypothetical protein